MIIFLFSKGRELLYLDFLCHALTVGSIEIKKIVALTLLDNLDFKYLNENQQLEVVNFFETIVIYLGGERKVERDSK